MRLSGFDSPGSLREVEKEFAEPPSPAVARLALREEMLKGVRSWATWSIIIGLFSFAGLGSAPWGVVLVLVGLGSLVCKAGSMYVVYGIVMAWAGLSNLRSGTWYWIALAALQAYWAFRAFRDFARFREAGLVAAHGLQGADAEEFHDLRAQKVFPWASLALGTAWVPILMVVFVGEIVHVVLRPTEVHGPFPAPSCFCWHWVPMPACWGSRSAPPRCSPATACAAWPSRGLLPAPSSC